MAVDPSRVPTGLLGPDHRLLCMGVSLLIAVGYFNPRALSPMQAFLTAST